MTLINRSRSAYLSGSKQRPSSLGAAVVEYPAAGDDDLLVVDVPPDVEYSGERARAVFWRHAHGADQRLRGRNVARGTIRAPTVERVIVPGTPLPPTLHFPIVQARHFAERAVWCDENALSVDFAPLSGGLYFFPSLWIASCTSTDDSAALGAVTDDSPVCSAVGIELRREDRSAGDVSVKRHRPVDLDTALVVVRNPLATVSVVERCPESVRFV